MSASEVLPLLQGLFGEELDEVVIEYVSESIAEAPTCLGSVKELRNVIGDTLLSFGAAEDDEAVVAVCVKVIDSMGGSSESKTNSSTTSASSVALHGSGLAADGFEPVGDAADTKGPEVDRNGVYVGAECTARYSGDGHWYNAVIRKITPRETYVVFYPDYNEEEELVLGCIRLKHDAAKLRAKTTQLLEAPIVIDDSKNLASVTNVAHAFAKSRKSAAMDRAQRREDQRLAKERRKIERMERRQQEEFKRRKDAANIKWLASLGHATSRERDVICTAISLASPDGSKELIASAELRLAYGRRYGLIGHNGCGKSTLLRAISNYELNGFPVHLRVIHVEQDVPGNDDDVMTYVLRADIERDHLMKREKELQELIETAGDGDRSTELSLELERIYARMQSTNIFDAEARALKVLQGLQFTPEMIKKPTKDLSGGWRMRTSLASALFVQPDVLLLDESTNFLDFPSILWLENYLKTYPHTVVIVSHDRVFLNNVSTDILHLHHKGIKHYRGDYTTFERVREELRVKQLREYDANEKKRAHMQAFIDKFRYNAKRASLVQSRIKAVARLPDIPKPEEEKAWKFKFPDPGTLGGFAVELKHVNFAYDPERPLFNDVTLLVSMGSKIGIVGANGAGKTTLLKVLMGQLRPLESKNFDTHVFRNTSARFVFFTQHHVDQLDLAMSTIEFMQYKFPSALTFDLRKVCYTYVCMWVWGGGCGGLWWVVVGCGFCYFALVCLLYLELWDSTNSLLPPLSLSLSLSLCLSLSLSPFYPSHLIASWSICTQ
jgi:ATPase subunit of ABC transporter with duplicated ATPase domains